MRAVVVDRYGPPEVARVAEVSRPEPAAGEVLVRVRSTPVTAGDARIRAARFPRGFGAPARLALGLRGPRKRVLGVVFAGEVAALGPGVHDVAVGRRVAGMTGARMGAHAEYVAVAREKLVEVPEGVDDDEAAGILFGGTTAWHFLTRDLDVRGRRVLVNGASGAVGTAAVQLAHLLGAHVTGVTSAANVELVRSLGSSEVVDYRATDVAGLGPRFDVVLDTVGSLGRTGGRALLAEDGVLLLVVSGLVDTLAARGPVRAGTAPERPEDISRLLGLVAAGELRVVIDDVLPLRRIADAYRRVDSGRKVGNLLVRP